MPATLRQAVRHWPLLALSALLWSSPLPATLAAPNCEAELRADRVQARELLERAGQLDVLLLGEIHASADDHTWQQRMLEALAGRRRLSLGLEMIPAARQPILDRYSAGRLDEAAFLQQVGWDEVWGHDPALYLPLLRWARQRGVPLLALNAEPELVRRVRRQGLSAVPPAQREGIGTPAAASAAYRQRLEAAWRGHQAFATSASEDGAATGNQRGPHSAGTSHPASTRDTSRPPGSSAPTAAARPTAEQADLERFIASQLLRDRAMAERIAAAHRRDPGRLVVALIGLGHLEGGDGVPHQLQDLGLRRLLSQQRPPLSAACGPAPARARLGAYLESEGGVVRVRRVAPGSAAAAAGLRPGDRILELNGRAVEHAGEVIRGVRLQADGVPLRLTIERAGQRLRLELLLPPRSDPRLAARDNGGRSGGRRGIQRRPNTIPIA